MLIRQRFQKHVLHFQSHFDFRPFQWSYVSYPCVRTKLVAGGKAFLLHTLRWHFSHDLLQVLQLSAMLCLGQFRWSGVGGCRNVCRIQFGSSLKVLFNHAQAVGEVNETCARFGSVSFTFCLNSAGDGGFAVKFEWECPLLAPFHHSCHDKGRTLPPYHKRVFVSIHSAVTLLCFLSPSSRCSRLY